MDEDFVFEREELVRAVDLLGQHLSGGGYDDALISDEWPDVGHGAATLDLLAPVILGGAAHLGPIYPHLSRMQSDAPTQLGT
nr:hypothetical protein [uncultured Sphingosinicella sp.]